MTKSSKDRLLAIVPPEEGGVQANFCRTPGCKNFGVPPSDLPSVKQRWGQHSPYTLTGSLGASLLKCWECERHSSLVSNRALSLELSRLRSKNGVLLSESCTNSVCANHRKPVNIHPGEYWSFGRTAAGKPRKRCRRCRTTVTTGLRHKSMTRRGINKDIVLDLVNRASLNGILRKHGIGPKTLYERIDFIHEQMCAFEAAKLKALKNRTKFARHPFALATDSQDHMVNWLSRDRRIAVQLSCITTADNLSGFVFRSDLNFDPTIGDIVADFAKLLDAGEFDDPRRLGLIARYEAKAYFSALRHLLERRIDADKGDMEASRLLDELDKISPQVSSLEDDDLTADNPISGVVVRKTYTAMAHFMLLHEMLPAEAQVHFSMDADGTSIAATMVAMPERFRRDSLDMTVVMFEKNLSNPKKRARVKAYKTKFLKFASGCDLKKVMDIRRAFIEANKTPARPPNGIFGQFWNIPIQTMYEPNKVVGIVHQHRGIDADDDGLVQLELLDRASLHSADSFFSVLRKRFSFFDRGGQSRSTGTHYNPFQPYRPEMVQKIVDIARVYFNWCEPRPFRLVRDFQTLEQQLADSGHETVKAEVKAIRRRARREEFSTPAMRMKLARAPVRLETILYTDWRAEAFSPAADEARAA